MSKTILYLDDASTQRLIICDALREAGHQCLEAEDGIQGLEILEAHLGQPLDIILCDVNMPKMNGLEFVGHIKADPNWQHVPIVMLTTEAGDEIKNKGMALGVRAWALKPCAPAKLLKVLERLSP